MFNLLTQALMAGTIDLKNCKCVECDRLGCSGIHFVRGILCSRCWNNLTAKDVAFNPTIVFEDHN